MGNTKIYGIHHFDTIQDAIDHSSNGQTIIIGGGIYKEVLVIKKDLKIIGESNNTILMWKETKINDNINFHVITIQSIFKIIK